MTTAIEANQRGEELRDAMVAAITDFQLSAPRTKQAERRQLGMSEIGGCREYIRATIAGEKKVGSKRWKYPAYVGTAFGDFTEGILRDYGFDTQEEVTLTLPTLGIEVLGHTDVRGRDAIVDIKTVAELDTVRRDGPSFKHIAQISGYLIGAIQAGKLDENATGHLVYFDRSGRDDNPHVWSTNVDKAKHALAAVEERLQDVAHALAVGDRISRTGEVMTDEPRSWCLTVQCPFAHRCWAGYGPKGTIEHPLELELVDRFISARAGEKAAKNMRETARDELAMIEGTTPDGTTVEWSVTSTPSGGTSSRLSVREPKD